MITRRDFTKGLAAATLAAWPSHQPVGAAEESPLPIVDTHQHLWDLSVLQLPWLKPGEPLTRSFVMHDYLEATRGLNVVKAVYMEVAAAPEQKLREAEYVLELCGREDNPTVAAVIGGEPGRDGFREYIKRFRGNQHVKGVRHIPHGGGDGPFLYEQQAFIDDVRLLGELGMSFDLCMPPQRFDEAIRLVDHCPDTRFILDHCGNADPKAFWDDARRAEVPDAVRGAHDPKVWRRGMKELAKRDGVVCKISGIVARAPKGSWTAADLAPVVNHCLGVFGPDRVMFASDWPVCTRVASLREWVAALQEIVAHRSVQERKSLFAGNAIRFYGLEAR